MNAAGVNYRHILEWWFHCVRWKHCDSTPKSPLWRVGKSICINIISGSTIKHHEGVFNNNRQNCDWLKWHSNIVNLKTTDSATGIKMFYEPKWISLQKERKQKLMWTFELGQSVNYHSLFKIFI